VLQAQLPAATGAPGALHPRAHGAPDPPQPYRPSRERGREHGRRPDPLGRPQRDPRGRPGSPAALPAPRGRILL